MLNGVKVLFENDVTAADVILADGNESLPQKIATPLSRGAFDYVGSNFPGQVFVRPTRLAIEYGKLRS
jgi:hypothetical protein